MDIKRLFLTSLIATSVIGCGNLSEVTEQGTTENPVWPKIENSQFNHDGSQYGSWPNWDNVNLIESGMNKDQIYNLIGRPHFNEGLFGVREWDYVFNFRENGQHKICQFKVLFDKQMNAQSLLWYPENCANRYEFSGDFLFDFNATQLSPKGREHLAQVAEKLKAQKVNHIRVAGYTDRLGSESYNLALSQQRAEAVKQYLVTLGISSNKISSIGYGKSEQVKSCEGETGKELKNCLAPNRRVVITAE
ncbi:SmpA/OmlA family protein [Volucribacter psittacicida]|uniref:SmpA/OmlA family protein n=1 Tax=Volucribacter psittacicida TaxID=203482 RepID=A0A4R1FVM5_9PAST|nr:OmpA family protein [Volucribacter psittacicida]TCJ97892.1 SmpA/OmlA family protein [Volucribacter psittacicida]